MAKTPRKIHVEVWERQIGEREKPWEAFVIYRDLPSGDRSMQKVYTRLEKSRTLIERWSKEYFWTERVRQYDVWKDQEERRKTRFERNQKQMDMLDRHTSVAVYGQNQIVERFRGMTPADWAAVAPEKLVVMFQTLVSIERLARGLPTDSIVVTSPEQIKMQAITEARMQMNELAFQYPALTQGDLLGIVCAEFEIEASDLGFEDKIIEVSARTLKELN